MPSININNASNQALRYLNNSTDEVANSIGKLASGSHIVQASDDSAGLAIAAQLQSSQTMYRQDSVNIRQGLSILAIADSSLAQISQVLMRMLSLATQAASGQVTNQQRASALDSEYQQLAHSINAIASNAEYGGQSLLNYQNSTGAFSWASSSVLAGFYAAQVLRLAHRGAQNTVISTPALGNITDTGQVGIYTSGIDGLPTGTSGSFNAGPLQALNSYPFGPTRFITGTGAAGSISLTIGAFNTVQLGLETDTVSYQDSSVDTIVVSTIHGPVTESFGTYLAANPTANLGGQVDYQVQAATSNIASQSAAMTAITAVGSALATVSGERASLGAYESRFHFSDAVAQSSLFSVTASLSVLQDADGAAEKANLTAEDVQTQAAIAAATQASLLPAELLKLIQEPPPA